MLMETTATKPGLSAFGAACAWLKTVTGAAALDGWTKGCELPEILLANPNPITKPPIPGNSPNHSLNR